MEDKTRSRKWLLTINNPVDHNCSHDELVLILSKFNIHNNFINIMCVYLAPLINIYFIIYISSFNAFRKLKKIQISTLFREK